MTYSPITKNDVKDMLNAINVNSLDELFNIVPEKFKLDFSKFNIPEALSEQEVYSKLSEIGKKKLAERSIHFEQKILKDIVGSQDQIAASYGGFNKIVFNESGGFKVLPFSIKQERIKTAMKESIKPVLQKLGIDDTLVLAGIRDVAVNGEKDSDKLKALFELADILEIKETKKEITAIGGAVFKGFLPQDTETIEERKDLLGDGNA